MIYEVIILTIFLTTCASYVRALKIKTAYNITESMDDNITNYTNVTQISFNESVPLRPTQESKILETLINNTTETYNTTFFGIIVNESILVVNDSFKENYNISGNESYKSGNISNFSIATTYFDQEKPNTINYNDNLRTEETLRIDDTTTTTTTTTTLMIQTEIVSKNKKHQTAHPTKSDAVERLKIEEKKVMLQHHLHLGNAGSNRTILS